MKHQAAASAKMLNTGGMLVSANGPTPAINQVIRDQANFYGQSFVRSQQDQFGYAKPIPQPKLPVITSQQSIDMGKEALRQLVPPVFSGAKDLALSQHHWDKASKLEEQVQAKKERQTLKALNPVRFEGDKFYDAYEAPEQIHQAFPQPLLTRKNNEPEIYFSEGFQNAVQRQYGQSQNPFGKRTIEEIRRGAITPDMPQPIQFRSSTGWEYSPEHEKWLGPTS